MIRSKMTSLIQVVTSKMNRGFWIIVGLLSVGVGVLGVILPLLPHTPFFVFSLYCFSKSSPRLKRFVMSVPFTGNSIRNFQSDKRLTKEAKIKIAICIAISVSISAYLLSHWVFSLASVALGCVGICAVFFAVPTRSAHR